MDGVATVEHFAALHSSQLRAAAVPPHLYPALCRKLLDQIFDAGEVFSLLAIDYGDEVPGETDPAYALQASRDLRADDPCYIYLVDHAWTFRANDARTRLGTDLPLAARLKTMAGLPEDADEERVLRAVWRLARFYWCALSGGGDPEEGRALWYVMDEVGSAIRHDDEPNFRAVPFAYAADSVVYTLLFPARDVVAGEIVSRDFLEGFAGDDASRRAALSPWREFEDYVDDWYPREPDEAYFAGGRIPERLPDDDDSPPETKELPLKVFTQYARVAEHLSSPDFRIVTDPEGADVLWLTEHFRDYRSLAENAPLAMINQFPYEHVITTKDLLAAVARRRVAEKFDEETLETNPRWLPTTFNLKTELVEFLSYCKRRTLRGSRDAWICKPFNLARAMDTIITDDPNLIVRLSTTAPKIVQRYVDRPVLFRRPDLDAKVKFDVRYVVLLKSARPLRVFAYRNFFLRFANRPFAMDDFDEYEKHFTVMNYENPDRLFRMLCSDFVPEFERQNPDHSWNAVERDIFKMLKELFECAVDGDPPRAIAPCSRSRALYAADVILEWDSEERKTIAPKLLEVNWMPDCDRACLYYPNFYNDIFDLLFLDRSPDSCVEI